MLLIGGMLNGIFTATEAAAVAAFWTVLVATLMYRSLSLGELWAICKKTAVDIAVVMFILGVSNIYTWLLTSARIPQLLSQQIFARTHNYALVLLLITVLLLVLGCFVSSTVSINLLTTMVVSLFVAVGGDPLFFGIFMILVLMVGELTSPCMVLFALMRVTGFSLNRVVRASLPFYIPVVVGIVLCAVFPGIVTWLPRLLEGGLRDESPKLRQSVRTTRATAWCCGSCRVRLALTEPGSLSVPCCQAHSGNLA